MKRTMSILLVMLMTLAMLSGCQKQDDLPAITESMEWEVPKLNYGVLEYEKLAVVPWYSGRTEATSLNAMAETETGFYQVCARWLYYADKLDLSNLVPVCGDPSCSHTDNGDAITHCDSILLCRLGRRSLYGIYGRAIPDLSDGGAETAGIPGRNINDNFCNAEASLI